MSKKLLRILKMISQGLKDIEFDTEEILDTISYDETELNAIGEGLDELEFSDYIDEDEIEILKALLAYILIRDSSYDKEEIFSMIFSGGRRILWN